MRLLSHRVAIVGIVLMLFGGTMIAGGTYQQATSDCTSANGLHVTEAPGTGSDDEATHFDDLSPVEQRIFLEAYTGENNSSREYEDWSRSWFDDVRSVTYRGERFQVSVFTTACDQEDGPNLKHVGISTVLVGATVLAVPQIRRRSKK
jgi:hypothetical protein